VRVRRLASVFFAVVLAFGLFPNVSPLPAAGEEANWDQPVELQYEDLAVGESGADDPQAEQTQEEEPQAEQPQEEEPQNREDQNEDEQSEPRQEPAGQESGEFQPGGDDPILFMNEAEDNGLLLHYDMKTLEESDGRIVVKNVAGNPKGYDGLLRNPDNGIVARNGEAGFVSFNTVGSLPKSYIEIPKAGDGADLLSGLTEVTVSALIEWVDDGQNRWVFGFGTVADDIEYGNKYFFFTPRHSNGNVMASGMSRGGWRTEALIRGSTQLESNTWKLVTVVYSESTASITVYVDGALAFSGSTGDRKLSEIIDPNAAFSGFIAKSIFQNDPYYQGKVADFRVYGKALTSGEIDGLYTEASQLVPKLRDLVLQDAADALDMNLYLAPGDESVNGVTQDLALPQAGKHGVSITWQSSHPLVISGTVRGVFCAGGRRFLIQTEPNPPCHLWQKSRSAYPGICPPFYPCEVATAC